MRRHEEARDHAREGFYDMEDSLRVLATSMAAIQT